MKTLSVKETIGQACAIKPFFKPFLETFEPVLTQRRLAAEKLARLLANSGLVPQEAPGNQPFLANKLPAGYANFVIMAAKELLPALLQLETIAPHREALEALFLDEEKERDLDELCGIMLEQNPEKLIALAEKSGLEPQILEFVSSFIVSAVFRAIALNLQGDFFPDWRKGKCPVCGSSPIIAWLSKKPVLENNEFLTSGGGKKHLHCGMCGADWHILRGICPSCGAQGQDAMQILGEEDRRHERIDWCKKCQCYLPQIDLREVAGVPDMDAMALCLMHLDLAAAKQGLEPLKPSFWNMF